jgi:hypothetical protein
VVILLFVGLVTDVGSLYLTYAQLRRAVDSAAIAAANKIKDPSLTCADRKADMEQAAREMLAIHNVEQLESVEVYICDDPDLSCYESDVPDEFAQVCPDIGPTDHDGDGKIENPRKLAWVQATQNSPVFFLRLIGFDSLPITVSAVGEAATVDLALVLDSSSSMAEDTGEGYEISSCNQANTCQPMLTAKNAAKGFVEALFEDYDRVAVISFDFNGQIHTNPRLDSDFAAVKAAIDNVQVFEPADTQKAVGEYNPFDVDDVEEGGPPYGDTWNPRVTTCTGCGVRVAGEVLARYGRTTSLWVVIFLSDGVTNVSDVPTEPSLPSDDPLRSGAFPNGYCGGSLGKPLWTLPFCSDQNPKTRHCGPYHDFDPDKCPPSSAQYTTSFVVSSPPYDPEDYAYDVVDRVALLESENEEEPIYGNRIIIYSIGLGANAAAPWGEQLLRYMANVGEDGTRLNDSCEGVASRTSCGNYYFAPTPDHLKQIFDNIARQIFTRLSR